MGVLVPPVLADMWYAGAAKRYVKWGFIDQSGKMVIEPQFDDVLSFRAGLAAVGFKVPPPPKPEKGERPNP